MPVLQLKTLPASVKKKVNADIEKANRKRARMDERQTQFLRGEMTLDENFSIPDAPPDIIRDPDDLGRLEEARSLIERSSENGHLDSMAGLLPLLLNLNGEPYHVEDHFPFQPFYHTRLCRNLVFKTARQVSKSTNQAAQGVLQANLIPFFNTLFVTPLFEMIRRFSSNYVKPFIDQSPIHGLFIDSHCTDSVLQRTFLNNSQMYFSFAFLNADRTRGLNCAKVVYDEVQDFDPAFFPIIRETMSASKWGLTQSTGTPKTLDGPLENLWIDSSQAEWIIPCPHCKKGNIPSLEHDLERMLGPTIVTREISERFPAIVCASPKCGKPVNPRVGFWHHKNEDIRFDSSGYHVPQIIMPMHYADDEKWAILQGKRQGFGRTPTNVFFNEVCGESFDTGAKLLTVTDLRKAALLHPNEIDRAIAVRDNYQQRFLSVDWGGGGVDEVSFTTAAVLGYLPDGKIDVIYGWRSLTPNDPVREAMMILRLLQQFRCTHLVHDFGGGGSLRETLIIQAGMPEERCIPVAYQRVTAGAMMTLKPFNQNTGKRSHHVLDKTRSLQFTCQLIRHQFVRFFEYDYKGPDNAGLLHDFLSLIEDKQSSRFAQDLATIIRNEKAGPDDFAHAVNIGVCALCHANDSWPDVAQLAMLNISPEVLHNVMRAGNVQWDDWP